MTRKEFLIKTGTTEIYTLFTEKESLEAVKQEGYNLQYVREQTEAICLEVVRQNGNSLQYVREQTEAICLEAVRQYGNSLQYVAIIFDSADVKELTMLQIEERLGYAIKVVK